jgi:arylsulfatase A-like enzyme
MRFPFLGREPSCRARGLLLLAASLFVWSAAGESFAADQPRPNVLWLTSEDHGPHMGCYGDANARTPHVDALAAKGMMFRRAWSCLPVCAPARSAIISGMYPASTGAEHMRSMVPMPSGTKMYPQLLREAGYYCTNNSKEDYNLAKPGQVWDESSGQAHWKNRRAGQPFFAIFNSTKSHESQIRTRPHEQVLDPALVRVPAYHPDTPEVRQDWAQYYDKVSAADADAGARLRELVEAGLTEDTIVFYYADHGSGMPRSKRWPCNSGLHVPLVVYFPEKWRQLAPKEYQPGGTSNRLVNFVDLAPTVVSLAGVRPPDWMQGHAFAGAFQQEPPPYLHGCRGRMDECQDLVRSVTDGRYVYLRNYHPHVSQAQHVSYQFETPTTRIWRKIFDEGNATPAQSIFWTVPKAPEELYDLETDPDEVVNLASSPQHQAILQRLRRAQRDHAAKIRDVGFLPEGEIHSRSQGTTPYDMAQDDAKYPLARIFETAELASSLSAEATPKLLAALSDTDSAVRYWAALGLLMRGTSGATAGHAQLQSALNDASPYVRIVAAQALGQFGPPADLSAALAVLGELAPTDKNGVFVSMAALSAIQALGAKAAPLLDTVRTMNQQGPSPDARFNSYVPRLVADITTALGGTPANPPTSPKAKGKAGKKKAGP